MFLKEAEVVADKKQSLKSTIDVMLIKGYYLQNNNKADSALLLYNEAEKLSKNNNDLLCRVYNSYGSLYRNFNEFDSALLYFNRTVSLSEKMANKKTLGFALSSMVAVYERLGQIEKTKETAIKALDVCKKNGMWDRYLFTYLNIINLYSTEHQYDTALVVSKSLLGVDSFFKDGKLQNHKSNLFMMCADLYRKQSKYDSAMFYFDKVIEIALLSFDDKKAAESFMLKGDIYDILSDYPSSLEMYNKAIEYATRGKRDDVMAFALIGLGKLYDKEHRFEKAVEYTEKGIKIARQIKKREVVRNGLERLMHIYANHGDNKKAKEYFDEINNLPDIRESEISESLVLMANIFISEKKFEEGHKSVSQALELLKKYKDAEIWSYANIAEAQLFLDENKIAQAEKTALEVFYSPNRSNIPFVLRDLSLLLNKIYLAKKDLKNAYHFYILYIGHRDSIENEAKTKQFSNVEFKAKEKVMKKEMAAKENEFRMENKIHLLEIEKQKNFRNMFIAFLIVISILSVFIFRGFVNIRRSKNIIEKQKLLVDEKQKEILDSINYAKRIQQTLLPNEKTIEKNLNRLSDKA